MIQTPIKELIKQMSYNRDRASGAEKDAYNICILYAENMLEKEKDKVLAEYGTDTHDKILSMTDDFIQSNRKDGEIYSHYHYDMMADFALHILETFKTKEK